MKPTPFRLPLFVACAGLAASVVVFAQTATLATPASPVTAGAPATPAASAASAPSSPAAPSAPTVAAALAPVRPTGPITLFNGRDFEGLEFVLRGDNPDPAATFSVVDGVLKCNGQPFGYLRTARPYADYKLTVEWRFTTPGNTGLLVHAQPPAEAGAPWAVWPVSIEPQGQRGRQGDLFFLSGTTAAELANLPASQRRGANGLPRLVPDAEKPVGEWNTYEIIAKGDTLQVFLNGQMLNEATRTSVSSGYIGLQSEGSQWELRKFTVEPAPATLTPFERPPPPPVRGNAAPAGATPAPAAPATTPTAAATPAANP